MEVDSGLVLMNSAVEKMSSKASCLEKIGTPEVATCHLMEMGPELQVEKGVKGKLFLQAPLENKKGAESLARVCELPNNRDADAETITRERDILELSTSSSKTLEENLASGCRTPKESIFDPFAPGPEELVFAPKKKPIKETEVPLRRQLNFELSDHPVKSLRSDAFDDTEEDVRFLELIFKTFLDLIISNQALESTARNSLMEASSSEGFRTPISVPLLSGILGTCPDAPLRPTLKTLKLSPSICRKLDFESKPLQDL